MNTNDLKNLPLTDWRKAFPLLSRDASNKLLMKQDVAVVGLYFQRVKMIDVYYRPLLIGFPLWKDSIERCLNPFFMQGFRNHKHLQLDIPIEQHAQQFEQALRHVQEQSFGLLKDEVKAEDWIKFLDYHRSHDVMLLNVFFKQADFLKHRLVIGLYLDDKKLIQSACDNAEKEMQYWKKYDSFERNMGKMDVWRENFYNMIGQRDEIMERIRINSMDKRFARLKESHLIL